ncbi:MAG: hypothetical protein QNJ71_08830 [Acidimicrobiia bacterium]|nr:hypothetical protein [Acidimicrobiia bacterium]
MLLALLAVAIVAALGYLAYQAARDEPTAPPVAQPAATFAQYPSHEMVQTQIDAAMLASAAEPSSVEIVQKEIIEDLRLRRFAEAFMAGDLVDRFGVGPAEATQAASVSLPRVDLVHKEAIEELQLRSLADASFADAWGAEYIAMRFGASLDDGERLTEVWEKEYIAELMNR